jgi:ribosomal protein S18 acetylase RimI-like enzyme
LTPREAEIGGLIVHPDHRRKSIGKLLLTHAEAWSAQAGCAGVRLRSRQSRTAAHAFYLAVGYERTKTSYTFWKAIKN